MVIERRGDNEDGALLGATVVVGRAGEIITEFVLALVQQIKLQDLASLAVGHHDPYAGAGVPLLPTSCTAGW